MFAGECAAVLSAVQNLPGNHDAKFQKAAAPLHPNPVKSKVWNQVCNVIYNYGIATIYIFHIDLA